MIKAALEKQMKAKYEHASAIKLQERFEDAEAILNSTQIVSISFSNNSYS